MPPTRQGFIRIEVSISSELHHRLKTTCKKENLKIIELTRDAITERVEFLEEKRRKTEERLKAEREAAGGRTKFTGFRRMSSSSLAPSAKLTPLGEKPVPVVEPPKPKELPIEYASYAEKIYAALIGGSAFEVRLCVIEATSEIRRRYPLSSPKEDVIIATLEQLVLKKREAASAATREESPEVVIDTSKVKTFGDVTPDVDISEQE